MMSISTSYCLLLQLMTISLPLRRTSAKSSFMNNMIMMIMMLKTNQHMILMLQSACCLPMPQNVTTKVLTGTTAINLCACPVNVGLTQINKVNRYGIDLTTKPSLSFQGMNQPSQLPLPHLLRFNQPTPTTNVKSIFMICLLMILFRHLSMKLATVMIILSMNPLLTTMTLSLLTQLKYPLQCLSMLLSHLVILNSHPAIFDVSCQSLLHDLPTKLNIVSRNTTLLTVPYRQWIVVPMVVSLVMMFVSSFKPLALWIFAVLITIKSPISPLVLWVESLPHRKVLSLLSCINMLFLVKELPFILPANWKHTIMMLMTNPFMLKVVHNVLSHLMDTSSPCVSNLAWPAQTFVPSLMLNGMNYRMSS